MANDIYSAIYDYKDSSPLSTFSGSYWSMAESSDNIGIAMFTEGFEADSIALASANCHWNRAGADFEPYENYCTAGLDFTGKTVGVVGHLEEVRRRHGNDAKKIYFFDIHQKPGDLPPEMEDELLPQCDIVVITGSSIQNRTLTHILELCPGSYNILVGPSVPRCPALLDFNLNRIAGMCASDFDGLREHVKASRSGTPYVYGVPFMIAK